MADLPSTLPSKGALSGARCAPYCVFFCPMPPHNRSPHNLERRRSRPFPLSSGRLRRVLASQPNKPPRFYSAFSCLRNSLILPLSFKDKARTTVLYCFRPYGFVQHSCSIGLLTNSHSALVSQRTNLNHFTPQMNSCLYKTRSHG